MKKCLVFVLLIVLIFSVGVPSQRAQAESAQAPAAADYHDSLGNLYHEVERLQQDLDGDGQDEEVVLYKSLGTASRLRYQVWHLEEDEWQLWLEKSDLYQGRIILQEGQLLEQVPLYAAGDLLPTQPRTYLERVYTFAAGKPVLQSEQTKTRKTLFASDGKWVNPPRQEIEAMIERIAYAKGVPAVLAKALAYTESNIRQFSNGQPLQSFDGYSWGIMQVSPHAHPNYDVEKLKYDIEYNIAAGIEIMLEKYGSTKLPTIGDNDPRVLENWYFALWAYNGWAESNNPNMLPYEHSDWTQTEAYQDKVLRFAQSQFGQAITPIAPTQLPPTGLPATSAVFDTSLPSHTAAFRRQKAGDLLTATADLVLRTKQGVIIGTVPTGTLLEVLAGPMLQNKYIRYEVKTQEASPRVGWVAINWAVPAVPQLKRLAGANRYLTAANISQNSFPQAQSADSVVIARGDEFADALTGSVLAGQKGGPLLLTQPIRLPSEVAAEVKRVLKSGGTIYLLGGTAAISQAIEAELASLGNYVLKRLSGSTREETARKVADEISPTTGTAIVAHSRDFPDALAISSYAAQIGIPILLTQTDSLNEQVLQYLTAQQIETIYVVGGSKAVSEEVFQALAQVVGTKNIIRLGGADRFETATQIAEHFFSAPQQAAIACGRTFPDALAGAVHAAQQQAPILLVETEKIPDSTAAYLTAHKNHINELVIYGGNAAVCEPVAAALKSILE